MVNYCNKYFGKDLDALIYQDIVDYFSIEREESNKIEFKSFHPGVESFKKKINGVIRGICAFLNSDGGILIWGAPKEVKEGNKTSFHGDLCLVDEYLAKDSLISKVSDSITPLPIDVNVKPIEYKGKYVYVFEIQKSDYSPHQFNHHYYVRLDGQTKPAPHYLVEALFKKISYPNMEGYIRFDRYDSYLSGVKYLDLNIYILNFTELQNVKKMSYSLKSEESVFYSIEELSDNFISHSLDNFELTNLTNLKYVEKTSNQTLHFGSPFIKRLRLNFNREILENIYNYRMKLILTFGGENTPLKISEYVLDFSKNVTLINPKDLVKSKKNNIQIFNYHTGNGKTKELILSEIIQ
jgi:hypothetical protein